MNDLQIGAGLLNASRNAARARDLAQSQLEESRRTSEHARVTAEAAKETARAEQERLALERERFEAEEEDRFSRQEAQKQQKRAREILADAIVEFGEIAANYEQTDSDNTKIQLGRQVAVVQAKVAVLENIKDALTELSDITEFRKLKVQVAKFIQSGNNDGRFSGNPLEYAAREVEQLYEFAARSTALHKVYSEFGMSLFDEKSFPILFDEWNQYWQELHELREALPARIGELRESNNLSLWQDNNEANHELLALNAVKQSLLTQHPGDEVDVATTPFAIALHKWHLLSQENGPLYEELLSHLKKVQFRLEDLHQQYESDKEKWGKVESTANQADYILASNLLSKCHNRVVDDSYKQCVEAIRTWEVSLENFVQEPIISSLEATILRALPSFPFSVPGEIKARRLSLAKAKNWINAQRGVADNYKNTEFGVTLITILSKHSIKLKAVTTAFDKQVVGRYAKIALIATAVIMVFIGCVIFYNKVQQWNRESEVAAAIERQKEQEAAKKAQEDAERARQEAAEIARAKQQRLADELTKADPILYSTKMIGINCADSGYMIFPSKGSKFHVVQNYGNGTVKVKADTENLRSHLDATDTEHYNNYSELENRDEPLTSFEALP